MLGVKQPEDQKQHQTHRSQHHRNNRIPFGGDGTIRVAIVVGNPEGGQVHIFCFILLGDGLFGIRESRMARGLQYAKPVPHSQSKRRPCRAPYLLSL